MTKIEHDDKVTILFLSWRDIHSAKRGGAEVYTHNIISLLPKEKYRIIHFSPKEAKLPKEEEIDGILYLRKGNILSVINAASRFYKRNKNTIDFVVDQCNTHRFFTPLWVSDEKRIFFIHQLTREIWQANAPFPISTVGYFSETPFLRLSRNDYTIAVSHSTRHDLLKIGFDEEKVFIVPEGIDFTPWPRNKWLSKEENPTFIYVGRYVDYKGIDKALRAFAEAHRKNPSLRFRIIGKKNEGYSHRRLKPIIRKYSLREGIDVIQHGFVTPEEKLNMMSAAHALIFPSSREGWGLTITEAAAVGTPSIVFDSPGLRDAVDSGKAGYLCKINNEKELTRLIEKSITDSEGYKTMQNKAYAFACHFQWKKSAQICDNALERIFRHKPAPALPCNYGRCHPKAALLVTSYNNEDRIEKTLWSCLNQHYPEIEIIHIDDGSSDDTFALANRISQHKDRLHCFQIPHGERGLARKRAFEEAHRLSPDYILFFDSDMELLPDLVGKCVSALEEEPSIDALVIPEKPWTNFSNLFSKVKVFERAIVNNSGRKIGKNSIEAARFWRCDSYNKSGGINFDQIAFEEIQPTIRCLENGGRIERITTSGVCHDEGYVTLKNLLKKKNYYFSVMNRTLESEKNGFAKALRRWYFFRPVLYRPANIIHYLRHPILATGMFIMYWTLTFSAANRILFGKSESNNPQPKGRSIVAR